MIPNEDIRKITQTAGRDSLGAFAPDFAYYNDDVLFGENRNNTDIDLKTGSIITVVALMSQGMTSDALKYHHPMNAKNHGVSRRRYPERNAARSGARLFPTKNISD